MGDAACHLDSVCLSCGRFVEGEHPADGPCPHCAEPLDGSRRPVVAVRPAGEADAAAVGALTEDAYRVDGHLDGPGGDRYAADLRDAARRIAEAVVLVAEADGVVVGTITLAEPGTPYRETGRAGELEVRMLAVAPEARRRGVARALMAAAEDHAQARRLSRVVLCTEVDMAGAHRLYARLGYRRQPERDWSPDGYHLLSFGRELDR